MPKSCWAAERHTHSPGPSQSQVLKCWCMHILSHTAVKLPVRRPEERCALKLCYFTYPSECINTRHLWLKKEERESFQERILAFFCKSFSQAFLLSLIVWTDVMDTCAPTQMIILPTMTEENSSQWWIHKLAARKGPDTQIAASRSGDCWLGWKTYPEYTLLSSNPPKLSFNPNLSPRVIPHD